jgi:hypothetical protein
MDEQLLLELRAIHNGIEKLNKASDDQRDAEREAERVKKRQHYCYVQDGDVTTFEAAIAKEPLSTLKKATPITKLNEYLVTGSEDAWDRFIGKVVQIPIKCFVSTERISFTIAVTYTPA